ncbi:MULTISPECIES: primosomal replication protein N [Methylotenera]|uniref:primosomal replication protein N n=1 Tax=Methylotenera TaxID=359407 RepID=UPI000380D1C5|nr:MULTISPECIES: primosomal replication protein N [Methylotenera]
MNTLVISGVVLSIEPVRYTPAGIPLLSFVLQHASEQIEAGLKRKVECEVNAVAMGNLANHPIQQGSLIKVKGFLAKRSAKSNHLVLHVEQLQINPLEAVK